MNFGLASRSILSQLLPQIWEDLLECSETHYLRDFYAMELSLSLSTSGALLTKETLRDGAKATTFRASLSFIGAIPLRGAD